MPTSPAWQLLRALFFAKLSDGNEVSCMYDDVTVNEKLGIQRRAGTCSREDTPVWVREGDVEAFQSYISTLENASEKDLKEHGTLGTTHGIAVWKKFSKKVSVKLNAMVEEHMENAGVHPAQLMKTAGTDEWVQGWPTVYSSRVANSCTSELLGDRRTLTPAGMTTTLVLQSFVSLNYDRLRRCFVRTSKNGSSAAEELRKVFNGVQSRETIKLSDLQDLMRALRNFKKATMLLPNLRDMASEQEEFLRSTLLGLDVDPATVDIDDKDEGKVENARRRAKTKLDPADLADAHAVERTLNMYLEYFSQVEDNFDIEQLRAGSLWAEAIQGDMGVEEMGNKSSEELGALLGFQEARPLVWNQYKRKDNVSSAWDADSEETRAAYLQGGDGMEPVQLLWHQLAGVAAMASKAWVAEDKDSAYGMLLADDVGVGKTAQVMATVAFTQLVYECEQRKQARPALLKDKPSFMGKGRVPNAPHAIIVPNSLVDQWRRELKTFFQPHVIDIFIMPTQKARLAHYFDETSGSAWVKSKHDMIRRIVLVPHSVFGSLTTLSFFTSREGGATACVDDTRPLRQDAADFFKMKWCTAWIDEAHEFRTVGRMFSGAVQLRRLTHMMNVCTATPLFTKPEDTINLGRIIGAPRLCSEHGQFFEREAKREVTRIARSIKPDDLKEIRHAQQEQLLGRHVDMPAARRLLEDKKVAWVKEIQARFDGHIIRRDKTSKRYDGQPINDLEPYDLHMIPVTLQDWELDVLANSMGDVISKKRDGTLGDITSGKFYIYYRLNMVYPIGVSDDNRKEFPTFNSKEAWDAKPGSKLAMLIRLLNHLLSADDVAHATIENQTVVFPPACEQADRTRQRKILVYYEYPTSTDTVRSALEVNGIHPLVMNGTNSVKQRDEIVQKFIRSTDVNERVLLFSKVGAAGLNLACADVVILYDTVWSDQLTAQIIGRAHRLGQTKKVHVYQLLAVGTTDIIITSLARDKNAMLQALLTKTNEIAPGLGTFLDQTTADDDEGGDDDTGVGEDAAGAATKKGGKRAGKAKATSARAAKKKAAPNVDPSQTETAASSSKAADGASSSKAAARPRPKKKPAAKPTGAPTGSGAPEAQASADPSKTDTSQTGATATATRAADPAPPTPPVGPAMDPAARQDAGHSDPSKTDTTEMATATSSAEPPIPGPSRSDSPPTTPSPRASSPLSRPPSSPGDPDTLMGSPPRERQDQGKRPLDSPGSEHGRRPVTRRRGEIPEDSGGEEEENPVVGRVGALPIVNTYGKRSSARRSRR